MRDRSGRPRPAVNPPRHREAAPASTAAAAEPTPCPADGTAALGWWNTERKGRVDVGDVVRVGRDGPVSGSRGTVCTLQARGPSDGGASDGGASDGGTTALPDLVLSTETLDFGDVGLACTSETLALVIHDEGDAELELLSLSVDDATVTLHGLTPPLTLAPGAAETLSLTCVPDTIAALGDTLAAWGADVHIGVVTCDMDNPDDQGQLVGGVLTADDSDLATALASQLDQGTVGSGLERCFDATIAALTEPLASGANAGFRRTDAALTVVVLSDADDESTASSSDLADTLHSLAGDLTLLAIVGDPGTPPAGGCEATIDEVDGELRSICSDNVDLTMDWATRDAVGLVDTFVLSAEPFSWALIDVEVDGTSWPLSATDGWAWDEAEDAVVLVGGALPAPGASVTLTYDVDLSCAGD